MQAKKLSSGQMLWIKKTKTKQVMQENIYSKLIMSWNKISFSKKKSNTV